MNVFNTSEQDDCCSSINAAIGTYTRRRSKIIDQGMKDMACCSNNGWQNGECDPVDFLERKGILEENVDIVTKFLMCSLYDLNCNSGDNKCCEATATTFADMAIAAINSMSTLASISQIETNALDRELKCVIERLSREFKFPKSIISPVPECGEEQPNVCNTMINNILCGRCGTNNCNGNCSQICFKCKRSNCNGNCNNWNNGGGWTGPGWNSDCNKCGQQNCNCNRHHNCNKCGNQNCNGNCNRRNQGMTVTVCIKCKRQNCNGNCGCNDCGKKNCKGNCNKNKCGDPYCRKCGGGTSWD